MTERQLKIICYFLYAIYFEISMGRKGIARGFINMWADAKEDAKKET